MHLLTGHGVLDLWERVASCAPIDRGLAILATISSGGGAGDVVDWRMRSEAARAARGAVRQSAQRLRRVSAVWRSAGTGREHSGAARGRPRLDTGGHAPNIASTWCSYRLLTSADLVDAGACASLSEARQLLLERALVSVVRRGRPVGTGRLPGGLVERLAERLTAGDPWAESLLALRCPACCNEWTVLLDTAVFVWTALRSRAQRLVHDVHTLARAYGWREADILAMSTRRREAYLELVGA